MMGIMSSRFFLPLALTALVSSAGYHTSVLSDDSSDVRTLKALLVAGGCCHDYTHQHEILAEGIQGRANVQVDVVWTDDRSTHPPLPLYEDPNWADGYDVIIHDECAAGNRDLEVMHNILNVHQTVPAVHLHCAMHSFRNGTDLWFKHLGIQSTSHGPQAPIDIHFTDTEHPINETLKEWTTIREELYNNVKVFDAHPLATGKQLIKRKGKETTVEHVVAWINENQGARSFSTTLGHNTETVADGRYLELVTRGLLWACGKLNENYFKPYTGANKVTFVKSEPKPEAEAKAPGKAPQNATLVKISASSTQNNRFAWMAIDGETKTRWCAANASKPQWLQLEFDQVQKISGVNIQWESQSNAYAYKLEASLDGESWTMIHDASDNLQLGNTKAKFPQTELRFLKMSGTRTSAGGWISLWEFSVEGQGIQKIYPQLQAKDKKIAESVKNKSEDPLAKGGNVKPAIVNLSQAEEEQILKDASVPDGFDMTLFASSATANYPVYVAASPGGDLYVSSDGNGSLGRNPRRGRVLRLRDSDHDGRADEVKEFIPEIDSPRGLLWDHDCLYLLHPPHISVYFDRDKDGVADASKRLISGIAFDFDQRPPDHTTNGLELGIDGWIYIAGGDFGFMDAVGTDGRRLQHRGGGVIRFRPDGTGLELFATGTRNILGTPMSPLLNMFARDNTNDGGGWDVRLHHFSGLEDHGYPRLYKNFGEEHIQPLADYGGGSGCGSVYIHEPGFPSEWANAPFTCDWGRAATFHHRVKRQGATFVETETPKPFIKVTRPTDADVDAMSRVYQASWKGPATFNWAGPDHGYILRVSPKGFEPEPLPDFPNLTDAELVVQLQSPSHIRALTAQRALLRREEIPSTNEALLHLASDHEKETKARVAALYAITQRGLDSRKSMQVIQLIEPLIQDTVMLPFVMRAIGDLGMDQLTAGETGPAPIKWLNIGLASNDPRTRLEAIITSARQNKSEAGKAIAASLGHTDGTIAHTAFRALAILGHSNACFAILDAANASDAQRKGASYALMRMHRSDVVEGLIARLNDPLKSFARPYLLSSLCRLYHREANWNGDSWGTRPDTRGPYYQLENWSQSEKILQSIKQALVESNPSDAAKLIEEMNRNRIQSNEALERIISLALEDASHLETAVTQLAEVDNIPDKALPLLLAAARSPQTAPMALSQAIVCLSKVDRPTAVPAILSALSTLEKAKGEGKAQDAGRRAFLNHPNLDNFHTVLVNELGEGIESSEARWASAGLLELASRDAAAPEAREQVQRYIDKAWQDPTLRLILINSASKTRNHYLDARIRAAVNDFEENVAKAAKSAMRRLRIPALGEDKTPQIATLSLEQTLKQVASASGDIALGEAVFTRAACATCHTVSQDQAQKGPYLGNIANTYRRHDLAESILNPNKTIAQGFATHEITMKDGEEWTGFVVNEAGDAVTLRDTLSQEHILLKSEIQNRMTLKTSIMPEGLMGGFTIKEMASLLDYLVNLSKFD